MDLTLHILDLIGTFVFAISGATAGGITRDLIIGTVPPAAFSNGLYF